MSKPDFSEQIVSFYAQLDLKLPKSLGVEVLNPFKDARVIELSRWYHKKYYHQKKKRYFLFGINPGRHGSGITGIPFTDPMQINEMGFQNDWPQRHELSAVFIQDMIQAYGGISAFAEQFYVSSVCPLGFIKGGKNINYYDEAALMKKTERFIIKSIKQQIALGCRTDLTFCIGQGKNYKVLTKLNEQYKLFEKIIPLPHPRWVMQYRLKRKTEFVNEYISKLSENPID